MCDLGSKIEFVSINCWHPYLWASVLAMAHPWGSLQSYSKCLSNKANTSAVLSSDGWK